MTPLRFLTGATLGILLVLLACPLQSMAQGGEPVEVPEPIKSFMPEVQKRVGDLRQVPVGVAAGQHEFFSVRLDEKPVEAGGARFGCVRFVAPPEAGLDMVWAFVAPPEWSQWYILPEKGTMEGFKNWINADRLYEGLPTSKENAARLQTLSSGSLEPGKTYILWFREHMETKKPPMLVGTINFLKPDDAVRERGWDAAAVEKGLGLKAAPAAEQVSYLGSRGGQAMLDTRFFAASDAENQISHVLTAIRQFKVMSGGFYVEMKMSMPPCKTEPLLGEVQAAHGQADLVLSADERRLFEEDAPGDLEAHYYDRFVFEVGMKKGRRHILRVTTQATDVSDVRPVQNGLTWSDVPMPNFKLRLFYKDGKEIARVAFWGQAEAKILSGHLPTGTYERVEGPGMVAEELVHLGEGAWEYRSLYPDGQVQRTMTLRGHAYDGPMKDYYPDGKPKVEATFEKGLLEGELKLWNEDGEIRTLRYKKGEAVE